MAVWCVRYTNLQISTHYSKFLLTGNVLKFCGLGNDNVELQVFVIKQVFVIIMS